MPLKNAGKPMLPVGTVQDELERRGDCRYGLRGVRVTVRGHEGTFTVSHTEWNEHSKLVLTVYPSDGPEPRQVIECIGPPKCLGESWGGPFTCHTLACYQPTEYPAGTLHDVPAEDCTLASKWPCVCCRPRRRAKRGS